MGVSIREYARMRGVSHTAVANAVKGGRISAEPDGSIDPEKANVQWEQNSRPRVDNGGDTVDVSPAAKSGAPDYKVSRAIREAYAARLAKQEFEEKSGKLVNLDEVKIATFNMARQARDRLLQIPRKLAPAVIAEWTANADPRGVEDLIEAAVRDALEGLPE